MKLELIGIAFVLIGIFILLLAGLIQNANVEYGGVVMIGPIPLVFGNSRDMALIAMGLTIVLLAIALLLR